MLLSRDWLAQYTDIPKLSSKELALKLTMSVVEVEGWEELGEKLSKIIIGKVLEIQKHPDADKLSLVEVDAGKNSLKVVCGGQNLKKGMLVAFAPVGAKVRWHGEEEWTELKPAKIRGVESRGMICAAEELGLPVDMNPENGILDLSGTNAKPGQSFSKAIGLDDTVFDIDNKSITHRPDLWGHYGMARELAALFSKKLKDIELAKITKANDKKLIVKVEDSKLCPRYCGIVIDNVKIESSPMWMQKRLIAAGIRPINNIVDATNYVLLELGQPLHAFDYNYIPDGEIIVRRAKDKEKITTIDDEKRSLSKEMLVIAAGKGAVAVAGVMGGANSEINENTTSVIIESANFDGFSIRKTATELGLRTESSARFEKNLDPNLAKTGILRAVKLILDLYPDAKVASQLVDVAKFKLDQGPIHLDFDLINKKIGIEIPKKQVISILKGLGFEVKEKGKGLRVKVPTWRATNDISIPEDLVEEVARIYGYDNIEPKLPELKIQPPEINLLRALENQSIQSLVGLGLSESHNYSFVSEKDLDLLDIDKSICVRVKNPLSKEEALLRPKLLVGLLKNIVTNQRNYERMELFEIGSIHWTGKSNNFSNPKKKTYLPNEAKNIAAVFVKKGDKNPFVLASEALQNFMFSLGLNATLMENEGACTYCHPARRATIKIGERVVGEIFELHPAKQNAFDIDERVGYWEMSLEEILKALDTKDLKFSPLSKFPSVRRDISLLVPQDIEYGEIENLIFGASEFVSKVSLFDIYEGKGMPKGTKSIALHIEFQSKERTLEAEEIDNEIKSILDILKSKDIELRQ